MTERERERESKTEAEIEMSITVIEKYKLTDRPIRLGKVRNL